MRDLKRYLVSMHLVGGSATEVQRATLNEAKATFLGYVKDGAPRPTGMFKAEVYDRNSTEPDWVLHVSPRGAVKALTYDQELKMQGATS